jgi:hypothetical protein
MLQDVTPADIESPVRRHKGAASTERTDLAKVVFRCRSRTLANRVEALPEDGKPDYGEQTSPVHVVAFPSRKHCA